MRRTLLCILLLIFSQSAYSQMTMRELTVDNQKIKVLTTLDKYGYEITEPKFEMIGEKPSVSFQITAKKPLSYRLVLGEYSNGGFVLTNTTSKLIRLVPTKPTPIYLTLDRGSIESIAIGILQTTDKIPSNSNRVQASKIASKPKMGTPSNAGEKDDKNDEDSSKKPGSETEKMSEPGSTITKPLQVNGSVNVIAEGSGESADEAVKDAFRNAVRQVVGSVVDAETLVKDDQVIADNVLTYSRGFIETYEEVAGSKSFKSGIHRIQINAVVKRWSLTEKLKSANVAMKEVDGKGMFAELISKQSGESNATELLQKALAGLPTLLKAKIVGKVDYDRTTSEVVVMVEVTPDEKAYLAFVKRLEETLKKVAISTDSAVLRGVNQEVRNSKGQSVYSDEFILVEDTSLFFGPKTKNIKSGDQVWCLWICSSTNGKYKTQRWSGYILPGNPKNCFIPLLMPEATMSNRDESTADKAVEKPENRLNSSKTILQLFLIDKDGVTVADDSRELTMVPSDEIYNIDLHTLNRLPLLRAGLLLSRDSDYYVNAGYEQLSNTQFNKNDKRFTGLIAPFFFIPRTRSDQYMHCSTKRIVEFRIKVTEEELKRFDAAKVEISFSE